MDQENCPTRAEACGNPRAASVTVLGTTHLRCSPGRLFRNRAVVTFLLCSCADFRGSPENVYCNVSLLLGGSREVISGIISPLIGAIIIVILLRTPLITSHEPSSILEELLGNLHC